VCWWHLGGHGFQLTRDFLERLRPRGWSDEHVHDHWMRLLDEYVDHDTPVDRVGRPGFFTRLGDTVDFSWSNLFAIEGPADVMPLASLRAVNEVDRMWFAPLADLPRDVVLLARDVDGAYQEYGFRDDWMFKAVLDHLRRGGSPADEVREWPHA
jgi:hypothetical protein